MDKQTITPPYEFTKKYMYSDMEYARYTGDISEYYIQKFYEAGYITSKEYKALHEALNKTTFNDGCISTLIYVDERKLRFVCVDEISVQSIISNKQVSASIYVYTSTGKHDFSVNYSRENDKFYEIF